MVGLRIKLMDIKNKIRLTREKQTRYQQIEDLCYVNQSTNEEAINNLNIYLGNLKKVLLELEQLEQKTSVNLTKNASKYKHTIVKYKQRKTRGNDDSFCLYKSH
jgi:alanyl-tRNA synthetase